MNRIDPKVVAAYFAANPDIEPIRGAFVQDNYPDDDDGYDRQITGCCGITAMLFKSEEAGSDSRSFATDELDDVEVEHASAWLAELLGLDSDYVRGFVNGWDNHERETAGEAYDVAYEDGQTAYYLTTGQGRANS